jgi:hypothetical protein
MVDRDRFHGEIGGRVRAQRLTEPTNRLRSA